MNRVVRRLVPVVGAIAAAVALSTGTPPQVAAASPSPTVSSATRSNTDASTSDSARLAPVRAALASTRAVTVAVLGDSVGNDPGEWVSMWAGNMAINRYVFVHHFDAVREGYDTDVEVFAPTGPVRAEPIVVWNFGRPGGTPQAALDKLSVGVPVKPDVAIVSFGHNVRPEHVQGQYSALFAGLRGRFGAVPTVTTLAHMTPVPRSGQAEGRVRLLRLARSLGHGVVDERAVYDDLADPGLVLWDAVHPNVLGYRKVADLVTGELSRKPAPRPRCARPSTAAARTAGGRITVAPAGAARRHSMPLKVTDTCGGPLANAWVQVAVVPSTSTRAITVSTQTDRRGVAVVDVVLGRGVAGSITGTVTDGTTTVPVTPIRVPAAR